MDKLDALKQIICQFSSIQFKEELICDIQSDVFGSGLESSFFKIFLTRLKQLDTFGYRAITEVRNKFEKLTDAPGLYSMHIDLPGLNYRIIYTIDKQNNILLQGFNERSGKKATDYTKPISIAKRRLKER